MNLYFWSSCLYLPKLRIYSMCHHTESSTGNQTWDFLIPRPPACQAGALTNWATSPAWIGMTLCSSLHISTFSRFNKWRKLIYWFRKRAVAFFSVGWICLDNICLGNISGVNSVLSLALLADRVHLESDDCLHVYFMRLWFSWESCRSWTSESRSPDCFLSFRVPVVLFYCRRPLPEAGGSAAVSEKRAWERGRSGHPQPRRATEDDHQKGAGRKAGGNEILPTANSRLRICWWHYTEGRTLRLWSCPIMGQVQRPDSNTSLPGWLWLAPAHNLGVPPLSHVGAFCESCKCMGKGCVLNMAAKPRARHRLCPGFFAPLPQEKHFSFTTYITLQFLLEGSLLPSLLQLQGTPLLPGRELTTHGI